ncbi:MAG TPA: hypothetical protein O0X50_03125, partial [Methanocorpusculum sp.]|nr:hypothetical protein [Methanocorpusculum sp.]
KIGTTSFGQMGRLFYDGSLLYYKPKEIVLCSYGMYFRMKDLGCSKLPTEVRRELDSKYIKQDNKLFKQYVMGSFESKGDIKSNFKKYRVYLEREFRLFLIEYAKENNLLHSEGKL